MYLETMACQFWN